MLQTTLTERPDVQCNIAKIMSQHKIIHLDKEQVYAKEEQNIVAVKITEQIGRPPKNNF